MKKLIALLVVCTVLVGGLAGCGDKKDTKPKDDKPAKPAGG